MSRSSFISLMAAILIAGLQPAIAGADSRLGSGEEEAAALSFSDAATNAGTAAALVNRCQSDTAPIESAFMRALDDGKVDPIDRQVLLERYRKAEVSTISALAKEVNISCTDTKLIIQNTIHELSGPHS